MSARARRGGRLAAGEAGVVAALAWATSRVLLAVVLVMVVLDGRSIREALRGWDAGIYVRLAESGYTATNDHAFFPGLPLLLRAIGVTGLDTALAGVLISLVSSGLAAGALFRLGRWGWGPGTERVPQPVVGAVAATLWLVAPTTVFTAVAYTEAPFCAAAFWAWERARERRWGQAAVLAAVACSLRVSGVFLVLALLVFALVGNGPGQEAWQDWRDRWRDAAWLVLPTLVVAAYVVWLHRETGSWQAWLQAQQQGWGREFTTPGQALRHTWRAARPSSWPNRPLVAPVFLAEICSMLVGLAVTVACLARRRWAEACWVGLQVAALGTSYWYMSVNRAALLWFPLFLSLAGLLGAPLAGARRRGGQSSSAQARLVGLGVVAAVSVVLALVWAWLYFSGNWAS